MGSKVGTSTGEPSADMEAIEAEYPAQRLSVMIWSGNGRLYVDPLMGESPSVEHAPHVGSRPSQAVSFARRELKPCHPTFHLLRPPVSLPPVSTAGPTDVFFVYSQGGFIFPLFFAGAALGRALLSVTDVMFPDEVVAASPVLLCMCFAAGLNVAVTRTPFASPLILASLAGQPNIMAPGMCAALASLFVTRSSKFIGPQRDRADLRFVGDLQPLGQPSVKPTLSPTEPSADDLEAAGNRGPTNGTINGFGRRPSVVGPDSEMASLRTEDDSPRGYSAMIGDGYSSSTPENLSRAFKAALQTNA